MIDANDADLWNYIDTVEETVTKKAGYDSIAVKNYGFKLKEGIDKEVIPEVLRSFRNLYEQLDQYSYMGFSHFTGTGDMDILNQFISDLEYYLEILNTRVNVYSSKCTILKEHLNAS